MTRRVLCGFLTMLAVLALSVPLYAAQTISHQGRLLDADDKPVTDGFYGATFSLWDDPVAGTMVWSELRDIQTKSGLFSVELGTVNSFFDIFTEFSSQDLYLQVEVQVSGSPQTLSPRLRLGTVPRSQSSRTVHGTHLGPSGGGTCLVLATDSGAVSVLHHDSDGDGINDRRVSEDCDDTDASVTLSSRAPGGGGGGGGAGGSVHLSASDLSSSSSLSVDLDGDGVPERNVDEDCDGVSASRSMSFFDIFTETTIDDDCDGVGARRRLSSGNIGSSGEDGVEISMVCSPDSAVESSYVRRNGAIVSGDFSRHTPFHNTRSMSFFDIFTEMSIDQDCDDAGARLAINSKGTSAKRTAACSADATTSSVVASGDLDGDGLDDSEVALRISPTQSSLAIKTKGTSAQRFSGGTDCDDADAHNYLDCDDDGDGIPESSVSSSSSSDGADFSMTSRLGGGMPNRISMNVTVAKQTQGATFGEKCFVDGDDDPESEVSHSVTPTTSSVAIKTKGTGADANRSSVSSSSSPSSSSVVCDQDSDGDGVAESFSRQTCTPDSVVNESSFEFTNSLLMPALMKAKEKANRTKCSNNLRQQSPISVTETEVSCDSADARSTWTADGFSGSVSSVTIQASVNSGVNPIEHSSGAHLTPGGVWTNASDENLKENFQPVDGEEILEKIEQLEITQWNYKNESDEVTHIGPTAQDFKEAFGVGSNDKSISTIDPSGVALVAVKELRKENKELKAQVAELKKMVEELARKK